MQAQNYSMLCLGDSYTIGESVNASERFPEQAVELLKQKNILFNTPTIIAQTGWTTNNLINAIAENNIQKKYDVVTLLIGVNDQYQGIDTNIYKKNFYELLKTSIRYAGENEKHVFVLSIPDYSVTPFAKSGSRSAGQIKKEIEIFNSINKKIAASLNVNYIDVTQISRKAKDDSTLLANDGLHPSAKMYALWAQLLINSIQSTNM